jgi:glycosyltransferase involved in cell wall biosynthesis
MIEERPKVSVIVPVYKVEKYLEEAVLSLTAQTLREIEIILVDDCSPDSCPAICDRLAANDSRIKVIHLPKNIGLGPARNAGMKVMCGEYFTFVDSDDYVSSDTYETAYALAVEYDVDIVRFRYDCFDEHGSTPSRLYCYEKQLITDREKLRDIALSIFSDKPGGDTEHNSLGGSSCTALYRNSIYSEHHICFVDDRYCASEDYLFNFDCLQVARSLYYTPEQWYHYRYNSVSLSHKPDTERILRVFELSETVEKRILDNGYCKDDCVYAMGYSVGMIRAMVKMIFMSDLSIKEKREWLNRHRHNTYLKKIYKKYPKKTLSVKHKIGFEAFCRGYFVLLYALVVGQERARAMLRRN